MAGGEEIKHRLPKNFEATKFCRGQILCRKNLVGFLKTVLKKLVGIPCDEMCSLNFFLGKKSPGMSRGDDL